MEENKKNNTESMETQKGERTTITENESSTKLKKTTDPRGSQTPDKNPTYAQKFGTYGAIAGILVMVWVLPSAGSLGGNIMMGALCGAGGGVLGTLVGALIDKVSKDDHSNGK